MIDPKFILTHEIIGVHVNFFWGGYFRVHNLKAI